MNLIPKSIPENVGSYYNGIDDQKERSIGILNTKPMQMKVPFWEPRFSFLAIKDWRHTYTSFKVFIIYHTWKRAKGDCC